MSGVRETRKKLQRSVLYIAQCEKPESALHELTLLKRTVDSQVILLSENLNREDYNDATNPQAIHESIRQADEDSSDPIE